MHARRAQLGLGAEIPHLIILKPLDKLRGMLCLWNNIVHSHFSADYGFIEIDSGAQTMLLRQIPDGRMNMLL